MQVLAFSEKKIGAVEAKMADLAQKSNEIDQKMKAITERESLVSAVKSEVESVYQISARSRVDLQYVSDHREEVASLRRQVQELRATATQTDEKISAIDARRKTVDEVQSKTSLIANADRRHSEAGRLGITADLKGPRRKCQCRGGSSDPLFLSGGRAFLARRSSQSEGGTARH